MSRHPAVDAGELLLLVRLPPAALDAILAGLDAHDGTDAEVARERIAAAVAVASWVPTGPPAEACPVERPALKVVR